MLHFYKDGDTLYPATWEYNATLIMQELARIIINNGGRIDTKYCKNGFIVNRSLLSIVHDCREKAEAIREAMQESNDDEKNTRRAARIADLERQANEAEAIPNDPQAVFYNTYLSFVLDGMYYYIQLDDNPFFPFYYQKTPITNGTRSKDACLDDFDKSWLWDCFLSTADAKQDIAADRKEAANIIFNGLLSAKNSVIRRDSHRRRVSNTYNSGYHYETVYAPERREKIDF